MLRSTLFWSSSLPLLALCQSDPINSTGFGAVPADNNALLYYNALTRPAAVSSHQFQGFNLNVPITNSISNSNSTNSTDSWALITQYDRLQVPSDNGNISTGITEFALAFPENVWPLSNTDWGLCASLVLGDFPSSISSKSGNSSSADCGQYLGDACLTAITQAYREKALNAFAECPGLPDPYGITECAGQLNGGNGGGIGTSMISNITMPGLVYYSANNSYLNPSTGQTYTNTTVPPRQGLHWGQFFAYFRTGFPSSSANVNSSLEAEGRQLRMIGLSLVPSENFTATHNMSSYTYQPNVRLLCARADITSGAMGLKAGTLFTTVVAASVAWAMML